MNAITMVARKELRAFFHSSVAVIFIGMFLVATLVSFFTLERFFGRNIADLRPLFDGLPALLLLLVSALTMRAWAEERRLGTFELFLTLPLRTHELVLGKFVAAVGAVAVALAATLPLPIMVSLLGPLDWGPVIGGYAGALFLGAAYAAIGLAVSARTDNQIVALMATLAVGGALYLIGGTAITGLFGGSVGDALRALGTGSRFESVARGVLDLRDLVYYAGVVAVALAINVALLESGRLDTGSRQGGARRTRVATVAALVVVNAALANLWLAPVTAARADLTEGNEYSLSDVTVETLRGLDEPLFIEGYFSERSHPLLAPLVPQLRDLVSEYEIKGRGNVRVSFADPNQDEELQARLQEDYGVRSVPFRVADRTQQAVVNAYFHVVVRYGDRYETLSFDDLIEVEAELEDVRVRLRSPEYDLTRAIRRVTQDFQTTESLLASLSEPARLTLYASPDTIPEDLDELLSNLRGVGNELASLSGNLEFREVDPTTSAQLQETLRRSYQIVPMAVDLFAEETFYLDLVFESGDVIERIIPSADASPAELRSSVEAALRRSVPGQLTSVAILTRQPAPPMNDPNLPPQFQQPPEPPDYRALEQLLRDTHDVTRLAPGEPIPDTVDVLVVGKTGPLGQDARRAIDQYLMRGGSIVALAGPTRVSFGADGLRSTRDGDDLAELLEAWGVHVEDGLVLDPQDATFPIPVRERRGNLMVERVELLPYPLFPDIRSDGFDRAHPALAGVGGLTMPWASPLRIEPPEGVDATTILETSDRSYAHTSVGVNPDFGAWPETGFPAGLAAETGRQAVAVTLTGTFPSAFQEQADGSADGSGAAVDERDLDWSLPGARVAVVGSAEIASDLLFALAQQPGGEVHRGNIQFVTNLVDWSSADTDLLAIRSAGAFARTLRPMEPSERRTWELVQYGLALAIVTVLAVVPRTRRRHAKPFNAEGSR